MSATDREIALQQLPRVGAGELPEGLRWVLQAGMVDGQPGHWLTLEPQSGCGGGSMWPMSPQEVIRVHSIQGHNGQLQIAVGHVAKHVAKIHAFDERGTPQTVQRLTAAGVPHDYFVAWTASSALDRIVALDGSAAQLGQAEVVPRAVVEPAPFVGGTGPSDLVITVLTAALVLVPLLLLAGLWALLGGNAKSDWIWALMFGVVAVGSGSVWVAHRCWPFRRETVDRALTRAVIAGQLVCVAWALLL